MISREIKSKFKRLRYLLKNGISIPKYVYYNYFCKKIVRKNGSRLIPYKGAILDLAKGSQIILNGNSLEIGFNRLKNSKAETYVRLGQNAKWNCKNGALLFFGSFVDIKKNAYLDTGYFSSNSGCSIIAHKNITFGEDVMLGRNVLIYDSDFHQLRNEDGKPVNPPQPVVIEDHVWLTSNITILKGVTIGRDSLVTAQTVINKNMPPHSIIAGKSSGNVIKDYVNWNREECPMEV